MLRHPVVAATKSPAALLPAPLARTLAFALLALLGVAEWARMFEGGGLRDGLPWVLAAVLAGEMAGAAASLSPRMRVPGATLAALLGLSSPRSSPGSTRGCCTALGRAGLGHRARARGAERRHAPLPRRRPVAGHHAAARRRAARHRRRAARPRGRARDSRGFPFIGLAALLILVVTPITAIGHAALALARLRDRRADGLLPVARAAAAAAGHRGRGAGRDRARRRAAAEPGDRPRRPVVRLPRVRRGARHAGLGALQLGADLRPDHVAARRARDAADQDDEAAVLEAREPRGLRRPALGDARRARPLRARARGRPRAELERQPAVDRHGHASPCAA